MRITQLAFLGLSLVACRGGGGGGGDDDDLPDGPPIGGDVTIQFVQDDTTAKGTPVTLEGVVVTAIDTFGARTGDLWVEEPDGGNFSGVKVFGAPLDQVASLAPGDVVTITNAEKDEFALTSDMSGRTVTELKGAGGGMLSIQKTSTGTLPAPVTVDAAMIDMLPDQAAKDAEWEKYEGVLINVTNVRQIGDVGTFGGGAEDQHSFDASGGLVVESVLADIGMNTVGTCYTGISGIGDYFFDYLLLPRANADLVAGGTGCTAQQNATIAEVQAGTKTGAVVVNDVFVSAISFNKKNLWVSQSLNAAGNQGIFVFRGNGAAVLPAEIVVGAKVNVTGNAVEQNNDANGDTVTQIAGGASVTFVADPTGAPVPVAGQQAATLTVTATGEPFESVLVTLTNVKVTVAQDPANFGVGQMQQGATTFETDDDTLRLTDAAGTCYATITGIWTYQVFDNVYALLPISTTPNGTCP